MSLLDHYAEQLDQFKQQGNFRQAERHFQRALQAQPDYAIAHKNLAFLYELYLGAPEQAYQHYQT